MPPPANLHARYQPGQSGNATGRPSGFRRVARAIMAATDDGQELVDYALEVWRDPMQRYTAAQRWEAHAWLSDRAIGKPLAMVDLAAQLDVLGPVIGAIDGVIDGFSAAELAILAARALPLDARGDLLLPAPAAELAVIDAEATEAAPEPAAEGGA